MIHCSLLKHFYMNYVLNKQILGLPFLGGEKRELKGHEIPPFSVLKHCLLVKSITLFEPSFVFATALNT